MGMNKKDSAYNGLIELEREIQQIYKQCIKLKKQVDFLYKLSCRNKK